MERRSIGIIPTMLQSCRKYRRSLLSHGFIIQLRDFHLTAGNIPTYQKLGKKFVMNKNQIAKLTGGISGQYDSLSAPVLVNGEFMESGKVGVSVWDKTVQRGYGVFSVIPISKNVENGKLIASGIDLHLERLFKHAEILKVDIRVKRETVHAWVYKLAHKMDVECIVRVIVTHGATPDSTYLRGEISHFQVAPPNIYMLWYPKFPSPTTTLKTFINPWHPVSAQEYPTMKWLSYAPNIFFIQKAKENGFDNALFISADQYVLEGPLFSIGWFKEGELCTPSTYQNGILPSTTMAMTTTIAIESGIRVNVRKFKLEEVLSADEVFISGTHDLSPVTCIDQNFYKTQHLTGVLDKRLKEQTQKKEFWIPDLCPDYDFL